MSQIKYSLSFELGKPNKDGECLIYLRCFTDRKSLYPTTFRVLSSQFNKSQTKRNPVVNHPNADIINIELNNFRVEFERELLLGVKSDKNNNGSTKISDYINTLRRQLSGRLSDGTLRHYVVIQNKLDSFDKNAKFSDVSIEWLRKVEAEWRKEVGVNTINANMKKLKSILSKAAEAGILDKSVFSGYKLPPYIQNIPTYLSEIEIEAFKKVTLSLGNEVLQRTGYYFLLSCYTGYRISDLKAFNYSKNIHDGILVLRAKKNGSIVSIPTYPALLEVINYCKNHPFTDAEPVFRKNLKEVAKAAGIKKDIKPHSGRHTFAMLMISKGLSIDHVAELLGDSKDIARIYARISNNDLHKKIREIMG